MLRPEDVTEQVNPAAERRRVIERYFDRCLARGTVGGEVIAPRVRAGWLRDDLATVLDGYRREGWVVDEVPAGYRFRRGGQT